VTPPQLNLPAILPASVAEQIRKAQVRAATLGTWNPASAAS
jgi:survival-of-motor-neuron-related-splicing factor 30